MANSNAKDSARKEAFWLNQLQILAAWRGALVDKTIEKALIPALNRGIIPTQDKIINYAEELAKLQLNFAKKKRYREDGMTKTGAGEQYAAIFDIEYNGGIDSNSLKTAKEEIEVSLKNLFHNKSILEKLQRSLRLIPQRSLTVKFDEVNARAVPDLIGFFSNTPPVIIDWKVSISRSSDYWLQLAFYALALSKVTPHKDWPPEISRGIDPTEITLFEINLLTNNIREHHVTIEELDEVEDLVLESAWEIQLLEKSRKYNELEVNHFDTTRNPRNCQICSFRRICW